MHRNTSSTESEEMEEAGSAHLFKGVIQMKDFNGKDETSKDNRSLNKGFSLPKSSAVDNIAKKSWKPFL